MRGKFTSHQARTTIDPQLYNAKQPFFLFELQEWLGHRSPESTRHNAKISPTRLAKSFAVAGYFGRNLRSIAVLIDRDVDEKGRAGFEPRRITTWGMNCVRMISSISVHTIWPVHEAIFYIPISSTKSQLLEAKQNLLRMNQTMTLTD